MFGGKMVIYALWKLELENFNKNTWKLQVNHVNWTLLIAEQRSQEPG